MRSTLVLGIIPPLQGEFEPRHPGGNEFQSRDGRRLLDVQLRPQGVRDLHSAFLKTAQEVSRDKRVVKGILAVWMPQPSDDRISLEWQKTIELLKPAIAKRLALIVVRMEASHSVLGNRDLDRVGERIRAHLSRIEFPSRKLNQGLSQAFFEIFKILLVQWFRKRGPIAIGELMRRTGSSYPTVADALRHLEKSGEIARRSNRSVQIAHFPQKTWSEILALSERLRRTRYFADTSGRLADPADLYRRLLSAPNDHIAVGGVQAARHWDHHFNLNGLPRLDISVHMESWTSDLSFVEKLNPALKQVGSGASGVLLAVHPIFRAESQFEKASKSKIEWADPVETLLDLHELKLVQQAEAMIRKMIGDRHEDRP